MENIIAGDTVYTEEYLIRRAKHGCSLFNMLREIRNKRESELVAIQAKTLGEEDKIAPKDYEQNKNLVLDRIQECFVELGLSVTRESSGGLFGYKETILYKVGNGGLYFSWYGVKPSMSFRYGTTGYDYGPFFYYLSSFSKSRLKKIIQAFNAVTERWEKEDEAVVRIFEKEEKVRSMARASIKVMAEQLFKGSGYEYTLRYENNRTIVAVNIGHQRRVEISLTPKNFQKGLQNIIDFIDKAKALSDALPVNFKITHYNEK